MFNRNIASRPGRVVATAALIFLLMTIGLPGYALAQRGPTYEADRARAIQLYKENNFEAAIPLFEKLVEQDPSDRDVVENLGIMLIWSAMFTKDPSAQRKVRARGRALLVNAQELGADDALLNQMLEDVPPDGSVPAGALTFSKRQEADAAMHEGEAAFGRGDFPAALAAYSRALAADPKLYDAALFIGDVYYKTNEPEKAGQAYSRAIEIDPNRETAYRYWGDVLMRSQNKKIEARDKFVEAFISEPYNRLARAGLVQWAQNYGVPLANPEIQIPTSITTGSTGNVNITIDPALTDPKKKDGSSAWLMYGMTRALWMNGKGGRSEKFAKQFPSEPTYRHSLAEEVDALSAVITAVAAQRKNNQIQELSPSLANLVKLKEAGLLEAYILIARADEGIARDYRPYAAANRDKLRRYMIEYVIRADSK